MSGGAAEGARFWIPAFIILKAPSSSRARDGLEARVISYAVLQHMWCAVDVSCDRYLSSGPFRPAYKTLLNYKLAVVLCEELATCVMRDI